jgi:two-component system NarL family sensor kinase
MMPGAPESKPEAGASDLARIRHARELGALRIVALVRIGVAAVMIIATYVGLKPKYPAYGLVPWLYAVAAIWAAVVLFGPKARDLALARIQLTLLILDVAIVIAFEIASPDGAYVPLLALTLLPVMVVLDVSWQRAAFALVIIAATFTFEIFTDPVMQTQIGYGRSALASVVFVFLCCTVWLAVYAQSRQLDEISQLSVSRRALLADLMNASDEQRRTISEYIHDGPLQSVLTARQDISAALKKNADPDLARALEGLREATRQMREATFELHPAVLAGAGLARALTQLADATAARTGIAISTDIDPAAGQDPTDPMVFSIARELLSNVGRHSQATKATLTLEAEDGVRRLDVADNGVGMTEQQAAERLSAGHIGLASQRARIEATGGSVRLLAVPKGTHIAVTVPLAGAE